MNFSIQRKLFILLAGLTAAVLTGVLTSVSRTLREAIEKKVIYDFQQSQRTFRREQALRYEKLYDSAVLIGENTSFKANVRLHDPASVYFIVEEFAELVAVDLFIVTDQEGKLLAWLDQPDRLGDDLSPRATIRRAMDGDVRSMEDLSMSLPELWQVDQGLCQVASVPIFLNYDTVIGTITLGLLLGEGAAAELKGESQIDITFVSDEQLIASTIAGLTQADLGAFQESRMYSPGKVMDASGDTQAFEAVLAGEEIFAFISRLGEGESASFVATANKSTELKILETLQNKIFLAAAVSIAITVVLALVLGRTMSRPVLRLVEGMNQVKAGNLGVSLTATTRDEIGLLTNTFNDMIVNLRRLVPIRRWMARFASRFAVFLRRLAVFVFAAEWGGLSRRLAFQLFDTLLQRLDELTESLVFRTKSCVLGVEFLEALVARVGFHAILPSPRFHAMTPIV